MLYCYRVPQRVDDKRDRVGRALTRAVQNSHQSCLRLCAAQSVVAGRHLSVDHGCAITHRSGAAAAAAREFELVPGESGYRKLIGWIKQKKKIHCEVAAPSLTPRRSGDQVKTNRRARQQLNHLLLRHRQRYREGEHWTCRHWTWLRALEPSTLKGLRVGSRLVNPESSSGLPQGRGASRSGIMAGAAGKSCFARQTFTTRTSPFTSRAHIVTTRTKTLTSRAKGAHLAQEKLLPRAVKVLPREPEF